MAQPIPCDLCGQVLADFMVTNVHNGDTMALGVECVGLFAAGLEATAAAATEAGDPEQVDPETDEPTDEPTDTTGQPEPVDGDGADLPPGAPEPAAAELEA